MQILCILDFVATFVGCSESESRELCANAGKSVSSRFTVNSANPQEDLANGRPNVDCHPFFCFRFGFLRDRTSFLELFRHFALILDLKMNLMSPAVAMLRTKRSLERQEARNCPFCI